MVSILYGVTPGDVAQDLAGNVQPGTIGTVYGSWSGVTPFTNTLAVEPNLSPGDGTGGQVTADDLGRFMWFAEDTTDTLYLDVHGVRWPVNPTQIGQIVQTKVQAEMPAIEAIAQDAKDTADAALDRIGHIPSVNVLDFGAVGDGTTDDTAAFNDATLTGKAVYVPAGTYRLEGMVPAGWFFGAGVIEAVAYDEEIIRLDLSVPTRLDTVMVGDGHRNDLAIGQGAMLNAGTESGANVAVGTNALQNPARSQRNTAIGSGAGKLLGNYDQPGVTTTNGNARRNVWVGTDAGWASVWADRNTYVGSNAGKWAGDPDPIGHQHDFYDGVPVPSLAGIDGAGRWPTARTDFVGPSNAPARPAQNELDNADNVGVGRNALLHATRASQCVALGTNALAHGLEVRSSTAVGDGALRDGLNASFNTAVGSNALLQTASGQFNVAVGNNAMRLNTHTSQNVAMGYGALENLTGNLTAPNATASRRNVAIGYGAAAVSISASSSVAVGASSAFGDHSNAVAVGAAANAVVNAAALGSGANAAGASSIAVGVNASAPNTSSTAVGAGAIANANNSTAIGNGATTAGGANTIVLGNGSIAFLRCNVQSITALSDARDKTDVRDTTLGLQFIEQLRPVDYRYRPRETGEIDPTLRHGFIAQEVESTGSEFGGLDLSNPDRLGLAQGELIAPLVKAVQELSTRLAAAERRIAELEG